MPGAGATRISLPVEKDPAQREAAIHCAAVFPLSHDDGLASMGAQGRRACVLFDQLVGAAKQRCWHVKAKRLCSLHIDHEFEFGGLLHR